MNCSLALLSSSTRAILIDLIIVFIIIYERYLRKNFQITILAVKKKYNLI